MLWPPSRTRVPGWPSAPAVFTVLTAFGSKPTLGFPVVTIGTGNGVFFTDHSRYSTRAQPRYTGTGSSSAISDLPLCSAPGVGAAGEPALTGADLPLCAAPWAVAAGGSALAGADCAQSGPAVRNHTQTQIR